MFFDNLIFLKVFRKFIEFEGRLTFFQVHNNYTTILKIIYFCQNQYKCSLSLSLSLSLYIYIYIYIYYIISTLLQYLILYLNLYISRTNIDKSCAKQFKTHLIELVSTSQYIRESQRTTKEEFFGAMVFAATIEIKF